MEWQAYISLPSVWLGLFLIYFSLRFRLNRDSKVTIVKSVIVPSGVVCPESLRTGNALDTQASILD